MNTCDYTATLDSLVENGVGFDTHTRAVRMIQCRPLSPGDLGRDSYIITDRSEPFSLVDVCKNNGFYDALWMLRCVPGCDSDARMLAVFYAKQVESMMRDKRSRAALLVAENFAFGSATREELKQAGLNAMGAIDCNQSKAAGIAAATACATCYLDGASAAFWAASLSVEAASISTSRSANIDAKMKINRDRSALFIAMCNGSAPWQQNEEN